MNVRSGLPIWRGLRPHEPRIPSQSGDAACEVAVLGSGVTGALVAYFLIRAGVDTLLVDKGEPAEGSTSASTGLLQYEVDTPLAELASQVGEAAAVHAYRRGLGAIDEMEALVEELGDRCGFARRDSWYFASHWWHARQLKREFEFRRQHGFDVRWLSRAEVAERSSIATSGAIHSTGDAQIDPYQLTLSLIRKAQAAGLRVHAQTLVDSCEASSSAVVLKTKTGTISARRLVCAAGYEAGKFLGHEAGKLHSTYAMASEPLATFEGWPESSLIWETARPYFYARRTEDGRAIIGGGDTIFKNDHKRDGLVERKSAKLVARFKKLFPAIEFVPAFAWAGTFGETKDGLAYIGQPPGHPSTYFALGYGGNGITFSLIAARLIVDLYFGRPNADAEVFRFGR